MSYEVQHFKAQVLERSKQVPVLVDFWASWCAPCRALGPVLERLAAQAGGRWELAKVNTEEHAEVAAAFNIASIPAVKLFVNGEVVNEFTGAIPERDIRRFLEQALPSPAAAQLAEGKRLLNEGKNDAAVKVLEPIIRDEPGNEEASVLLSQAVMSTNPVRVESLLEPIGPDSEYAERAEAVRTLARLAQLAVTSGGLAENKVREKYLAGAAAVRSGDFGSALDAFIEVLERNKEYDDGGARKGCKAIFQLLGMRHPLVERSFRAFSSAVHS